MLKLKFTKFIEAYNKARRTKNPTLHFIERKNEFELLFKNYEYWEYCTIIKKETISEFGSKNNLTQEQAIDNFKTEYLYHAVELEDNTYKVKELQDGILNKANKEKNPYANSDMEKAMLENIKESEKKLNEVLEELL